LQLKLAYYPLKFKQLNRSLLQEYCIQRIASLGHSLLRLKSFVEIFPKSSAHSDVAGNRLGTSASILRRPWAQQQEHLQSFLDAVKSHNTVKNCPKEDLDVQLLTAFLAF